MLSNTRSDFLKTVEPGHRGIVCPACGTVMGIRKGSYRMVLTQNARFELNDAVSEYRLFLQRLEDKLELINIEGINRPPVNRYPYEKEKRDFPTLSYSGLYEQTRWERSSKEFVADIDYLGWNTLYHKFPRYKDFNGQNRDESRSLEGTFTTINNTIIAGFEPISSVGPLMDIVFEQGYVKEWMQQFSTHDADNPKKLKILNDLLKTVCPSLAEYLDFLKENAAVSSDGGRLTEGILRFQFYLAILLGHKSKVEKQQKVVEKLGVDQEPFQLPRVVSISPELLENLVKSELLIGNLGIEWPSEFKELRQDLIKRSAPEAFQLAISELEENATDGIETVKEVLKDYMSSDNGKNGQDKIKKAIGVLKEQIHRVVDFTCPGPPGERVEVSEDDITSDESLRFCGWAPKQEKTHSVIFIGSPGTGKSTVMLSGFTAFYNNIGSLGATITFDSPSDEAQMKVLSSDYWRGKLPEKTEKGFRRSIKFSLDFFNDYSGPLTRSNFVFSDIPGEKATVSLTESGSDPFVSRILKNAEAIVFFFDLSVEASIREKIKGLGNVKENFDQMDRARDGKADISQRQLLQKLVSDLLVQRGADKLKGTRFICVIPKTDLYVADASSDEKECYFLTEFCQDLQNEGILVPSQFALEHGNGSYNGLCSLGGAGLANADQDKLQYQREVARLISNKSILHLEQIGSAIGNSDELQHHRDALADQLRSMKLMLQYHFGRDNVYFLPVSAQGENVRRLEEVEEEPDQFTFLEMPEQSSELNRDSNGEVQNSSSLELGYPPNQKLAEYVFILPVTLLADHQSDAVGEGIESSLKTELIAPDNGNATVEESFGNPEEQLPPVVSTE